MGQEGVEFLLATAFFSNLANIDWDGARLVSVHCYENQNLNYNYQPSTIFLTNI
jgi:hypothetical protein